MKRSKELVGFKCRNFSGDSCMNRYIIKQLDDEDKNCKIVSGRDNARKQKKMTQASLGKAVGTSGDIIGKYERDEIKPSIDVAVKIAEAITITIDYLVKDAEYQNIDNDALKRLKLLEKLSPEDKAQSSHSWMPSSRKINCKHSCNKKQPDMPAAF